jgi:hypothetical protein
MFLDATSFSTENYDRVLTGWSRLDLVSGVTLDASIEYCDGGPFRTHLKQEFGWTIDDDGQASGCPTDLAAHGAKSISSDGTEPFTPGIRPSSQQGWHFRIELKCVPGRDRGGPGPLL